MKYRILSLMVLLLDSIGVMAQSNSYWPFDEDQYSEETIVYCDLVSTNADNPVDPTSFEVAAFIDGEARAVAWAQQMSNSNSYYFRLRVKGDMDTDGGQTITFKAYNMLAQVEYDLELKEEPLPVTFTGETETDPGRPGNLRHLYISEITHFDVDGPIFVNKGESVNLLNFVSFEPQDYVYDPANLVWNYEEEYFTVENNQLTAIKTVPNGFVNLISAQYGGISSDSAWVYIKNPATALTIKDEYKEITVNKGDWEALTDYLQSAYEVTPADATDEVKWVVNEDYIEYGFNAPEDEDVPSDAYYPAAAGTSTATAQILNADGTVRLSASLTVHIVVPVEDVYFDFSDLNIQVVDCNVGDDLTDFLSSHVKVMPEDATNKNLRWEVSEGYSVSVSDNGRLSAVSSGEVLVYAISEENPDLSGVVPVRVHHPAKDVEFTEETITATYMGEPLDITEQVKNNIKLLPVGFEQINGLAIYQDEGDCLNIRGANIFGDDFYTEDETWDIEVTATKVGEATMTVDFYYRDYLKRYTTGGDDKVYVQKSFNVVVTPGLTGFSISASDLVFGEEGVITLTAEPAGATFDASKVSVVLNSQDIMPASWVQTLTDGVDMDVVEFTVVPNLPGLIPVDVLYDGEIIASSEVDVATRFALDAGWQWRTINYGYLEPGEMELVFGSSLIEVRSQYELLYNDVNLGYFGELADAGLSQDVCYKIKMQDVVDACLLWSGDLMLKPFNVPLKTGWTWLPNIYLYRRSLDRLSYNGDCSDGDRIVSKNDGFAVYDAAVGQWVGSLTMLEPGEGYLYHTETSGSQLTIESEFSWGPTDDASAAPVKRFARGTANRPWQYDASQWRDNMSIVAEAANVADLPGGYSVGAFVGDECRGEGVLVNGRLFVTVHGKAGEQVSFRFRADETGELFDAAETLRFSNAAGSLKAPVTLTKVGAATGLVQIEDGRLKMSDSAVFDLSGRRVQKATKGIYIMNGHKVAIK